MNTKEIWNKYFGRLSKIRSALTYASKTNAAIVLGFSGGKDSTLLLFMLLDAIKIHRILTKEKKKLEIILVFNDTDGEFPFVISWVSSVKKWINTIKEELDFVEFKFEETKPRVNDSFFWRMIFRGYPPPTFRFRWCTELLKIRPTKEFLESVSRNHSRLILLSGVRDSESTNRHTSLKNRAYLGKVYWSHLGISVDIILDSEIQNTIKIAPLRDFTVEEVWTILLRRESKIFNSSSDIRVSKHLWSAYYPDLSPEELLKDNKIQLVESRFGCWFCTVAVHHQGLQVHTKSNRSKWSDLAQKLELFRQFIRLVGDLKPFRNKKEKGYSKWGHLKPIARKLIFELLQDVDTCFRKCTNCPGYYYLDRVVNRKGVTLRELLFDLEAKRAEKIIRSIDKRNSRIKEAPIKFLRSGTVGSIRSPEGLCYNTLKDTLEYILTSQNFSDAMEKLKETERELRKLGFLMG